MMQEVEVLKTIQELICSFFSEEQFTLSYKITYLTEYYHSIIIYRRTLLADYASSSIFKNFVYRFKQTIYHF